ncbi:MAG: DUF3179 domain-containing protein [Gammaproteobacteria bacterium]|nr:DUF3179 domain-containing protein [Gammaproteobacteria bacterium]
MLQFKYLVSLMVLWSALAVANHASATSLNGFNLDQSVLPVDEILRGGPPKDGIPAIDNPIFVSADKMDELHPNDMVLGITDGTHSKAYPIRILNWHEIVNDHLGDMPTLVTYCPLCGSGMIFERTFNDQVLDFGVSGLLYNSDVLLFDRQTDSLWSQIKKQAVTGAQIGLKFEALAVQHTSWERWKNNHPNTQVLSFDTGYSRRYSSNPYDGYEETRSTLFPVKFRSEGFHPKQRVIGIEINGQSKAWPLIELAKANQPVQDSVGGKEVIVHYHEDSQTAWINDSQGEELPSVTLFWFAWAAFHDNTSVYHYIGQ